MPSTVFRGTRRLVDTTTGEILETQVVERAVSAGDSGFHKVWLGHILDLVEEVGNAKMTVLIWLLKSADAQNQVMATYQEIASATGTGVATVQRLMRALVAANVIARPNRYGPWRLNPSVIFQGDHQRRMNVLIKYRTESQRDLFEDQEQATGEPAQLRAHGLRRAA